MLEQASWEAGTAAIPPGGSGSHVRHEVGASVDRTARIVLAFAFATMPFALWALAHGSAVPFAAGVLAIGFSVISISQVRRGETIIAVNTQIAGFASLGIFLTVMDGSFVDFGLATALLAPVAASLLGDRSSERLGWVLLVVAVAAAAAGARLAPDLLAGQHGDIAWTASIAYAAAALSIARSARALAAPVTDFGKAQIDTFRHLVEHIQCAVLRLSPRGEALFISRSSEELFGCPRYELAGTGVFDRMHVQDRPVYLTAYGDANRRGIARSIEVRMRRDSEAGDGVVPMFVWVEVAISPVHGSSEQGRYEVIAIFRDISRRKNQEQEMLEARQAAEEASQAKSRFLATVGHELRTPLNAIVGFSDMMTSEIVGKLTDGQKEYAELIRRSGYHLLDIVNMLLDMSKIEAGKFELQLEPFDPADLVKPCVHMVEKLAAEKGIRLRAEVANEMPKVTGDERAYRQIVINLLSNAIKFSHRDAEVVLSIKRQGTKINISVADSGIGMTLDTVARLGEPFFQAEQGLARRYEGTGLGLSIVKGLVELHEGALHIDSEPGRGTRMTVLAPLGGPRPAQPAKPSVVEALPLKPNQSKVGAWPEPRSAAR